MKPRAHCCSPTDPAAATSPHCLHPTDVRNPVTLSRSLSAETAANPSKSATSLCSPIVRSCTGWKRLSVNCKRRHDFPTPAATPLSLEGPCREEFDEGSVHDAAQMLQNRCAALRPSASRKSARKTCEHFCVGSAQREQVGLFQAQEWGSDRCLR
eukprot:2108244-Rhodomonas_salina.2